MLGLLAAKELPQLAVAAGRRLSKGCAQRVKADARRRRPRADLARVSHRSV
jgi:hypothetical protein